MTDESRKAAWESLNVTKDELSRIGDALKHEEFRKLLLDYAEEISDPVNKKIYESEITQLEKERGVDCTFINPEPGYVIKTSIDGKRKAFINVCKNDQIGKPTSAPTRDPSGARGLNWSLPYSQAPPRDDLDKKNVRCSVFDVVFHPDTHHLAEKNPQFRKMLSETAMDAVENSYNVNLDRKNIRFPKIAYKGHPRAAVIRKKSANPPPKSDEDSYSETYPFPYPSEPVFNPPSPKEKAPKNVEVKKEDDSPYTTPKHTIKYRTNIDIQEYTNDENAKMNAAFPKELIISIFLPLLRTTADVTLDVHDRWLELKSEKTAKYFLHLSLPYEVNDALGNARFDQKERKLVITLPVKPSLKTVADINRFDSGNESDLHNAESDDGTETKPNPKIEVLSENASEVPEQTKANPEPIVSNTFLNPDLHYSPVTYTCNVEDDVMAFTLHVKNVDAESVKHVSDNTSSFHVRFTSVGAGFFPIHHAFFVRLPTGFELDADRVSVETWDNNVVLQLALAPSYQVLTEYFVGIDEQSAARQELTEPLAIVARLEALEICEEELQANVRVVSQSQDELTLEISPAETEEATPAETAASVETIASAKTAALTPVENEPTAVIARKPLPAEAEKTRYYSESSGEELGCGSLGKKGILKKRCSVSRSLSESNVDDVSLSGSTSSLDPIPAGFGSDLSIVEEARKTVHFSDKIAKKVFRLDSCILSQKKKNQRKSLNKKRAQERRASESEISEGDSEKAVTESRKTAAPDGGKSAEAVTDEPAVAEASKPADRVLTQEPDAVSQVPAELPVDQECSSEGQETPDASSIGSNVEAKRHRKHRKGKKDGKISPGNSREGSPDEMEETAGKYLLSRESSDVIGGKNVQKKRNRSRKGGKRTVGENAKPGLSSSSDSRDGSPDLPAGNVGNERRGKCDGNADGGSVNQMEGREESTVDGNIILDKTDTQEKKELVTAVKKVNVIKHKKVVKNKGVFQNLEMQDHASMKIEELGFKNDLIFDLDM